VAWGTDTLRNLSDRTLSPEETARYLLDHYAQLLVETKQPARAFIPLVSDGWRRAWDQTEGGVRGFAGDIRVSWKAAREKREDLTLAEAFGHEIRCALCLSSISSMGTNCPPELLDAALRQGVITGRQARGIAEIEPDAQLKCLKFLAIAKAPRVTPDEQDGLLADALAAANDGDPTQDGRNDHGVNSVSATTVSWSGLRSGIRRNMVCSTFPSLQTGRNRP
jgi:hypothetical protein